MMQNEENTGALRPFTGGRLNYPLNEAARALGISRASIYRRAEEGTVRLIKIGGRRLMPAEELARLAKGAR